MLDNSLEYVATWFAASRDGDAAKREWYVWADPQPDGTAPNNWLSVFGGPAWAYQPARRQHYHHKFLRQQPKLHRLQRPKRSMQQRLRPKQQQPEPKQPTYRLQRSEQPFR